MTENIILNEFNFTIHLRCMRLRREILLYSNYNYINWINFSLFFQLPAVLSQVQGGASNFVPPVQSSRPVTVSQPAPVQLQQTVQSSPSQFPSQSVSFPGFQGQPSFAGYPVANSTQADSESDSEIPSLALPCRSGSAISEIYIPMISSDDKWLSDPEYRWC